MTKRMRLADKDPIVVAVVSEFMRAHEAAASAQRDDREFALGLRALRRLGANETHVRYLLMTGRIEHLVETTKSDSTKRTFRRCPNARFGERSCFVLAAGTLAWAAELAPTNPKRSGSSATTAVGTAGTDLPPTPSYDYRRGILRWGDIELSRLKLPAPQMEAAYRAFQDQAWVERVKKPPLSPSPRIKERQRDLVRRLNDAQDPHLIRFRSDGDCIRWHPER